MRFQHTILYRVRGITLPREDARLIISHEEADLTATVLPDPTAALADADRGTALANIMLDAVFGGRAAEATFDDRLTAAMVEISESRRKQYGRGPYLLIRRDGDVETYSPSQERELSTFVICFDGVNKQLIRSVTSPMESAALASLALATKRVSGFDRIDDAVVLYRDDGKVVYSLAFSASASAFVSTPVGEGELDSTNDWFAAVRRQPQLYRVLNLLADSFAADTENLRQFLAAWTSLEIFVGKVFPDYERELFSQLASSSADANRQRFMRRIQEVMKERYRLADRFALVSAVLDPESSESDFASFMHAKSMRDHMAHGQEVNDASLPVASLRELTQKYFRLHVGRSAASL